MSCKAFKIPSHEEVLAVDPTRKITLSSVIDRNLVFKFPPPPPFTLQDVACDLSGVEGVTKLLHDPCITLYDFEISTRRALFVSTDANEDIYVAPFLYMAQHQKAKQVYKVPIETLEEALLCASKNSLGTTTSWFNKNNTSYTDDKQIVLLFSTGRCGSTLMGKVLGAIKGVLCLQEPNPFISLVGARNSGGATDEEITKLIRIFLLAHCKPTFLLHDNVQKVVFKFKSQETDLLDLFAKIIPNSERIFMYRNAEGVSKSVAGMCPDLEKTLDPQNCFEAIFSGLDMIHRKNKNGHDMVAVYWLASVKKTLGYIRSGLKITCVRHEELIAHTETIVRMIANICSIDINNEDINHVLDVMKSPSQEGAIPVHQHPRLEDAMKQMRKLVQEQKEVNTPDYILPGTLLIQQIAP